MGAAIGNVMMSYNKKYELPIELDFEWKKREWKER